MTTGWIEAGWDAPAGVRAGTTTRLGGVSTAPFNAFNLAEHVDDEPAMVAENRARLKKLCRLPADPLWLEQTHSNRVIEADSPESLAADAVWTHKRNIVCAILTADCVPVLVCDRAGTMTAAIHVGWRGLCAGIIENTLDCLGAPQRSLLAWLGPHICSDHYEVGEDVRTACLRRFPRAETAFRPNHRGRWQCSLKMLVTGSLEKYGTAVTVSRHCTFGETDRFYSYRREATTGRMASLIWMDNTGI